MNMYKKKKVLWKTFGLKGSSPFPTSLLSPGHSHRPRSHCVCGQYYRESSRCHGKAMNSSLNTLTHAHTNSTYMHAHIHTSTHPHIHTSTHPHENTFTRPPALQVRHLLTTCGPVVSWKRVQGATGKLQAFGFCEYSNPDAGQRSIRLVGGLR